MFTIKPTKQSDAGEQKVFFFFFLIVNQLQVYWSPENGRKVNPPRPWENNDNKTQTNGTKHICYDSTLPSIETIP